jgi:hypothetical protein
LRSVLPRAQHMYVAHKVCCHAARDCAAERVDLLCVFLHASIRTAMP